MTEYRFDARWQPPAPVVPVHVGGIGAHDPAVLVPMLVDTGADCTLISERLAESLRLPLVDRVIIQGVGGPPEPVPVYAARLRLGARRMLARVVAFGDEALLGRDVLNRLQLGWDGPAQMLELPSRRLPRA